MHHRTIRICLSLSMLVASGCTHVKAERYEAHKSGTQQEHLVKKPEKGFEAYRPEPYILVRYTQSEEKPVETEIVWLPNYEHVTLVRQVPGIGTSNLSISYNGAMLSTVNAAQDSKTAETLSAILGPLASVAGAGLTAAGGVLSAGLTAGGGIVGEAIKLLGAVLGAQSTTEEKINILSDGVVVDMCPSPVDSGWVEATLGMRKDNLVPQDDERVLCAAIWVFIAEAHRLHKFEGGGISAKEEICKAIEGLLTPFDKVTLATLSLEDKGRLITYMARIEEVKNKVKEAYPAHEDFVKAINVNMSKAQAILLAKLGNKPVATKPFELYKINVDGTISLVQNK